MVCKNFGFFGLVSIFFLSLVIITSIDRSLSKLINTPISSREKVLPGLLIIFSRITFSVLLILYSLGLAIPFVLSGYLIQRFLLFSKNFRKNINLISKIGGIILLVTGILILTNQLQAIGFYIIEIFPFMQKFG